MIKCRGQIQEAPEPLYKGVQDLLERGYDFRKAIALFLWMHWRFGLILHAYRASLTRPLALPVANPVRKHLISPDTLLAVMDILKGK
jgi:hypothetical protein